MAIIKLEETKDRRRLHIGSFFVDLNESDYLELVKIFSLSSSKKICKLLSALKDIKNWDDDLEDEWDDTGYRAIAALKEFSAEK